jgi:S-(hydroxymethyl)glutathione dehydrogenase/alcohol dehydrogenase
LRTEKPLNLDFAFKKLIKSGMSNPRRMNAAVLESLDSSVAYLEGIEIPNLESGQVLVKILYSGVCGSQLMEISGGRGQDKFLPHLLGHEASGEVVAVYSDVTKVIPGDSVVLSWIRGQGISASPANYKHGNRIINSGQISTLSNFAIVSENVVFKHSESFPAQTLALLGCAIPTGAGIILNQIPRSFDNGSIAIFGLGGVGISALMASKSLNPSKLFGIDIDSKRLEKLKKFINFTAINPKFEDVHKIILSETDGIGTDFSIDASGNVTSIESAFKSVRKYGGMCVVASHPRSGQKVSIDPFDLVSGRNLSGTWGGMIDMDKQILKLENIYRENSDAYDWLSSKVYPLSEINYALEDMRQLKVIRPVIEMSH